MRSRLQPMTNKAEERFCQQVPDEHQLEPDQVKQVVVDQVHEQVAKYSSRNENVGLNFCDIIRIIKCPKQLVIHPV